MDTVRSFGTVLQEAANYELFRLSGNAVTVGTLVTSLLILLATIVISRLLQRAIRRAFALRGVKHEATVGTICTILNYLFLVIGVAIALETAGVKLASLFAAGALFAVGIGFAMQNIVQSFVSGIILASERSIKPGDVLEVDGRLVKVVKMGIRSTIVQTRREFDMIVPNSQLVQSTVMNYTLMDTIMRLDATVGVHYQSDMTKVREVLTECCRSIEWRAKREPLVVLETFGSSSVDWVASVWIDSPWDQRVLRGRLYEAVWNALKEAGITIAYPQVDVHFDAGHGPRAAA
jgi:small-conductance mechanosensitive channel